MQELAQQRRADPQAGAEIEQDDEAEADVDHLEQRLAVEERGHHEIGDGDEVEQEEAVAERDRAPAAAQVELAQQRSRRAALAPPGSGRCALACSHGAPMVAGRRRPGYAAASWNEVAKAERARRAAWLS